MKCTIDAQLITNIVDAVKDLNPYVNFDFTPKGLHFQVMDTGHVSLSSLTLPTDTFKEYECQKPKTLGINLKTLILVLKGSKGFVEMKCPGDKLMLQVEKNTGSASYVLNLLDVYGDNLALPQQEYDAKVVMSSLVFGKVVKDMADFSDTCTLHISDVLQVKSAGNIGSIEWKSSDCDCTVRVDTEPLIFSIPYLQHFAKAHSVSKLMTIEMKDEQPLLVTFPVGSGHLQFYLAPKVADE